MERKTIDRGTQGKMTRNSIKCQTWLSSSLVRWFPRSQPQSRRILHLQAARGQRVSFQACILLQSPDIADVAISIPAPVNLKTEIRRVGYVPMLHHNTMTPDAELDGVGHIPGFVPDVLYPDTAGQSVRNEVLAFWINLTIPSDIPAGTYTIPVVFSVQGKEYSTLHTCIHIASLRLAKRKNFHATHWFYADTIAAYYRVEPFSDAFWPLCRSYMRNYASHGMDTIYVPALTPPLDGIKRPTQLLGVWPSSGDRYRLDWSLVERWITLARQCGITHFEWVHLFSQWGAQQAIRVYKGHGEESSQLLWPANTSATSSIYRNFLKQYLEELESFLRVHRLRDRSLFHVSDEPTDQHVQNYTDARQILHDLAPWLKSFDALSHVEFSRQGLVDTPVVNIATVKDFIHAGISHWAYFCCGPRGSYLNRLLDTPLPKIRMAGWLLYHFQCQGFLHWGYNFWLRRHTQDLVDPFTVSDAGAWPEWPYGDTFVVYPGPDGPLDSIRWEVFSESLQDYALLQSLGIDPHDPIFREFRDFNIFPKSEAWLNRAYRKLLAK